MASTRSTDSRPSETDVNLPFFIADSTGPKHVMHTIRRDMLPKLDQMVVVEVVEAVAAAPEPEPEKPEKPKKKGWWPFG